MFESYIKVVFEECWDQFQLQMVLMGGNKKFYEFMKDYNKEREPILKKYQTSAAQYYRRKLCFSAKNQPFEELPPPKNAQEAAERAGKSIAKGAVQVGAFINEQENKYQVSQKATAMAESTKNAFIGLFNKAKQSMQPQAEQ